MQTESDFVNAKSNTTVQAAERLRAGTDVRECLSAMVDGEATEREVGLVTAAMAVSVDERQAWSEYHCVGQAMRSHEQVLPLGNAAFVAGVMARIREESVVSEPVFQPVVQVQEAANDAVFRWKMVAGVATLAAAAALVWQVAVAPNAGPQLAQAPAQPAEQSLARDANQQAVLTEHGVVIRDARLEALLAEHRQYGGMSALQMPAGFLRNATYEAPQR